ncbi:hypothetical protein [Aquibacillus rhizosphaerae]|uniref:Uncharacterized protein n=1 Tax=Aquibacillus rhizosphaerae TaxID=3051431 RepID=A0ABT7L0Y2_9BACI|nr:hypothetical protein [Aquibacillus sp. LR5S19]MDL4839444.1 hypothetical protein [Aquibacillus sp. LR5S19]
MYFPSKKDVWFSLIIWGAILAIIFLVLFGGESTGTQFITSDGAIGKVF